MTQYHPIHPNPNLSRTSLALQEAFRILILLTAIQVEEVVVAVAAAAGAEARGMTTMSRATPPGWCLASWAP